MTENDATKNDATKWNHILMVEDNVEFGRGVKVYLEAEGFKVQLETHGAKALLYAAEHTLDLAILDLNLPDLSGYEVCRQLRRLYRPWTIPIVMLTGMARPGDKLQGYASGSDVYLIKPVDPKELILAVEGLLKDTRAA